ncbi:hypothetical protein QS257_02615 [Terrilactibacillus sp. S3-3]|nr:hypothetical protein QS257_02615 [Terrilactibacillus sp. S3-3]
MSSGNGSGSGDQSNNGNNSGSGQPSDVAKSGTDQQTDGSSTNPGDQNDATGSDVSQPAADDLAVLKHQVKELQNKLNADIDTIADSDHFPDFKTNVSAFFINDTSLSANNYDEATLLSFYQALSDVDNDLQAYQTLNKAKDKLLSLFDQTTEDALNQSEELKDNQQQTEENDQSFSALLDSIKANIAGMDNDFSQLEDSTNAIQGKNMQISQTFDDVTQTQKDDIKNIENNLTANAKKVQQLTADISQPIQLSNPDIAVDETENGMALTIQDNNFETLRV